MVIRQFNLTITTIINRAVLKFNFRHEIVALCLSIMCPVVKGLTDSSTHLKTALFTLNLVKVWLTLFVQGEFTLI